MYKKWIYSVVVTGVFILTGCQGEEAKTVTTSPEKQTEPAEKESPKQPTDQGEEASVEDEEQPSEETLSDNSESQSGNKDQQSATSSEPIVVEDPSSITAVINKQRELPADYVPANLVEPDVPFYFEEDHPKRQMRQVAATSLEQLFQAAEEEGVDLVAASGYRSYDRQKSIYESNVAAYGEEKANTFSAKPGQSEHQTGLSMDVTVAQLSFKLTEEFGDTEPGSWLAEHAHEYGYIIRYPEGKSEITGYQYEPWHIRYVGKEVATEIYENNVTIEEYYNLD
ncbi:peptidase M15 [Pontibacillus halophilus JSM 076056 = DSM 19796]|uniref:Peptidase M15 n=1 Tax=Pontibacillus halophilus JSM 076056 = DSM 19796 TaxID=1385510 RepID=A0A0A5GH57_9BACI|nr:M15 family metallopeptidase [Pontibacillus halophilus]KGX92576.1 peptidase M15 [Pontibacillus halophilus JSM 076056 = DSM 19796]